MIIVLYSTILYKTNIKKRRQKIRQRIIVNYRFIFLVLIVIVLAPMVFAEVLYVDSKNGNDTNSGTKDKPLRSIAQAVVFVNNSKEPGPTTIEISAGVYCFDKCIAFVNKRPYTQEKRLTIKASVLPDDVSWKPELMPIILSCEDPRKNGKLSAHTETYSFKIGISHVTIQGLKFLGNPLPNNWHGCVERIGENMDDLLVTQCMFIGDNDSMNIYSAILATGDRFIVDHCIFKNCHACTVYWDGYEGIGGKGCAMKYCIVDGAYISGVWTCQTAEDFEFHHNVITNSEYFWMRKRGDRQKYKIEKCVIVGNKYWSGYGTASGPTGQTSDEVNYAHVDIIAKGTLIFDANKMSRNYMHIVEGSVGYDLGAGLFMRLSESSDTEAK